MRPSILTLTLLALNACFASAGAQFWCTGYYPGWEQGTMPPSAIDFTVITHVVQFSVVPNSNGTLDSSVNGVSIANSSNLVRQAHLAGRKALICVGGADGYVGRDGVAP